MEDTHGRATHPDRSHRREIGAVIDNRQGAPQWAPDGNSVYFTVQERGNVRLVRLPVSGGKPEYVVNETGTVGSWSVARDGSLAYTFTSAHDMPELYLKSGGGA